MLRCYSFLQYSIPGTGVGGITGGRVPAISCRTSVRTILSSWFRDNGESMGRPVDVSPELEDEVGIIGGFGGSMAETLPVLVEDLVERLEPRDEIGPPRCRDPRLDVLGILRTVVCQSRVKSK